MFLGAWIELAGLFSKKRNEKSEHPTAFFAVFFSALPGRKFNVFIKTNN